MAINPSSLLMVPTLNHPFTFSVTLVFIGNKGVLLFHYILTEEYKDLIEDDMPRIALLSDRTEIKIM